MLTGQRYVCVFVALHSHGVVSGELAIVLHTYVLADRAFSTCLGLRAHLCEAKKVDRCSLFY